MGIEKLLLMIPTGGKYAKSVVNFVHKSVKDWPKFKFEIEKVLNGLKGGKLRLNGKQKTIFETNKNILKNHETVTKKVEVPVKKPEDYFKGFTPTLVERSKARDIYKEMVPPASKYTKEMEKIDEELDALAFGGDKYEKFSMAEKAKIFQKLQADMKKLIDGIKKEDLSTLSLSQLNKKSQNLQKRIREIKDNPDIKGTVYSGPKGDMIKALYDSENAALMNARKVITKKNSELKYGKKYPVLDPENNSFIIMGLDESGSPMKMSRFSGRFSATKDKTTGDLTRSEGTSFYDKWNAETNQMRKEGEEIFKNTLNKEGKEIMSNPDYKIPKTENMEIWNEIYSEKSISDLAKKGHTLKDIDMLMKGKEANKYLKTQEKAEKGLTTYEKMHERTSTTEVGDIMEDLYNRGDDVYKMSVQEWIKKIPEHFAGGGQVPGFATGGVSNLFRERQGFRTGSIAKLPAFLKFVERLLIKASNEIRQGIGKWKGLNDAQKMAQHENLAKLATEFQKTKKFDVRINEYTGIDAEKAFIEAQSKVKTKKTVSKDRKANADELDDYIEILDPTGETGVVEEGMTIKALDKMVAEQKAYERYMYNQYKMGKLDPTPGDKSPARKRFLEKKLEEAELSGDKRLITRDEIEELSSFDLGTEMDAIKKGVAEVMKDTSAAGLKRSIEIDNLKLEFPGISDEMIENILTDTNPQRIAEVKQTMREALEMGKKGMSPDEIINTFKASFKRKPSAEGGLIPGYATGGVSNLFRSR